MAEVELIDIESSSDEEEKSDQNSPHISINKNENNQEIADQRDNTNASNAVDTKAEPSGHDVSSSSIQAPSEPVEDEDQKRSIYIDKLLNMHHHVCNRLASLEPHMDTVQRLRWQRQTSLSVPAIKGRFPLNTSDPQPSTSTNNRPRPQSSYHSDPDWAEDAGDSRPPWLITNGSNRRHGNNAATSRARRKRTYKKKKTTRKPTSRATTARMQNPFPRPVTTARKSTTPSNPRTASKTTVKKSTTTASKTPKQSSSSTNSTPKVKSEIRAKGERVKSERN